MKTEKSSSNRKIKELKDQKRKIIKKYSENEIEYVLSFFKEKGRILTRDEALEVIKQWSALPQVKDYKKELSTHLDIETKTTVFIKDIENTYNDSMKKIEEIDNMLNELLHNPSNNKNAKK
jgi:hypothetical protein